MLREEGWPRLPRAVTTLPGGDKMGGDGVSDHREGSEEVRCCQPQGHIQGRDGPSRRREDLELRDGVWGSTGRWRGVAGQPGAPV